MSTPAAALLGTTTLATASVPDWISAVSTAGALVFAGVAAVAAFRQLGILRGQARDRQAREEQAGAAGVAVWVRVFDQGGRGRAPVLRYINSSGIPVYNLTIWVATPEHTFVVTRTVTGPSAAARVMVGGTQQMRQQSARLIYDPDWSALLERGDLTCAMRFRDSSNQWWLRDIDGMLSPATSTTTPTRRHPGSRVVEPVELTP